VSIVQYQPRGYFFFGVYHGIKLEEALNPSPMEITLEISQGGNPPYTHFKSSTCVCKRDLFF
jgi:hypothetical protein